MRSFVWFKEFKRSKKGETEMKLKWIIRKKKPVISLNIDISELKSLEGQLLIVRVGTDDIPANEQQLDRVKDHLRMQFEAIGVGIPTIVVSSFLRFETVKIEDGNVVVE